MARPDERRFVTFRRGKVRDDIILARFRITLRTQTNPDTGQLFTEDEIAIITQRDSRFYIEADAIDLYGQAVQQRAIWFADQVRPERAASEFLNSYHGPLWLPEGKLDATGGSGPVTATGTTGTIFPGSTTLGDPTATVARDPAGKRYQVLVTVALPAALQMQAIDAGDDSNPIAGTVLTWINPPIGSDPQATVLEDFSGGFDVETDAEYARRIVQRIQNKPGAGNQAQFRAWAQRSSNAVEDGFIYASAFYSGSVLVAVTQKRGTTQGPTARIANLATLAAATTYLVPPASPVVPHDVHVLVTPVNSEPVNMALKLSMPRASSGGWADVSPWPVYSATYSQGVLVVAINVGGNPLVFDVETDVALDGAPVSGVDVPGLMIWNSSISRFELLDVASVANPSGDTWRITLNNSPSLTLAVGQLLSPLNNRSATIAEGIEDYFDELGPGEIVDSIDTRFVDAARYPRPDQEYSTRAGQGIIARLDDQLGGALAGAELAYISQQAPTVPAAVDMVDGPNMLTVDEVGVYTFD